MDANSLFLTFSEYVTKRSNFSSDLDDAVKKFTGENVTMLEVRPLFSYTSSSCEISTFRILPNYNILKILDKMSLNRLAN